MGMMGMRLLSLFFLVLVYERMLRYGTLKEFALCYENECDGNSIFRIFKKRNGCVSEL